MTIIIISSSSIHCVVWHKQRLKLLLT